MTRRRTRRTAAIRAGAVSQPAVVERQVLDNGLMVVVAPTPHLSQAYVAFYCAVGSRHEDLGNNGITHVLEHMLFRGTASHKDATTLNAVAEDIGGFLEGATYRDHLMFATGCHGSKTTDAIHILAELVQTPRYRGVNVEKAILREELLEGLDGNGRMVDLDNLAHAAVFGRHSLGLPIEGTLDNLERVGVNALEEHRRRFLVGNNSVVSIAGPVASDEVIEEVERAFGELPPGEPAVVRAPSGGKREPSSRFVRDVSSQVDLRVSFRASAAHDASYPALVMLSRLLADGLASRMHAELVDKRGIAYALNAGLTTYSDCGLFDFELSVAPDRAAIVVQSILEFAAGAGRFRYRHDELERTRRRYRYGLEFMQDSPADLSSWHGRASLFGVQNQMQQLGARIARLSPSELRSAAREVFKREGLVVTAVGELARGEWSRVTKVIDAWRRRRG